MTFLHRGLIFPKFALFSSLFATLILSLSTNAFAAPGDLDIPFRPAIGINGAGREKSYAVQPDGKIIVGGDIPGVLIRLNEDDTTDNTFRTDITFTPLRTSSVQFRFYRTVKFTSREDFIRSTGLRDTAWTG